MTAKTMLMWTLTALCMLGLVACHRGDGRHHHHRSRDDSRQMMHRKRQDGQASGGQLDESAVREYCEEMLRHHQALRDLRDNPSDTEEYEEQVRQHHMAMRGSDFDQRMSHHRMGHNGRPRRGGFHHERSGNSRFHHMMGQRGFGHHGRSRSRDLGRMGPMFGHHMCDQYIDMQQMGHRRGNRMGRNRLVDSNSERDLEVNLHNELTLSNTANTDDNPSQLQK